MADQPGRLVVSRLSKRFGPVRAVEDLSFTVEPGSVTGFLGPNGAGKTTTLRVLLGLVTPTSGSATIGGRRYEEIPHPTREVGAVLESSAFHPARTGRNHLRVYCAAAGIPDERADQVLEVVGLTDAGRRKVRGYSMGMRQRLALAFALLGDPRVLILDEPANGLDPEGIRWLRGFLQAYAHAGRTVLFSSHLLDEVEQIAERVVILARGRLVREGTLAELGEAQDRAVLVQTPQPDALAAALGGADGARVARTGPNALRVVGMPAPAVGHAAYVAGVELHELSTERSDLEQIFLRLTADGDQSGPVPGGPAPAGPAPAGPPYAGGPYAGAPPGGPQPGGPQPGGLQPGGAR
jgi:ABC-2 type transport system ATP-binding protein